MVGWVVLSLLVVKDNNIPVELELRIGGVGRTPIRGSWRQIWRGGEVVVVVIVEMRGGEGRRGETMVSVIYIIFVEHGGGGGGVLCCVSCVQCLSPRLAVYGGSRW